MNLDVEYIQPSERKLLRMYVVRNFIYKVIRFSFIASSFTCIPCG